MAHSVLGSDCMCCLFTFGGTRDRVFGLFGSSQLPYPDIYISLIFYE